MPGFYYILAANNNIFGLPPLFLNESNQLK